MSSSAEGVLTNRYAIDPIVGVGVVTRIRGQLGGASTAATGARLIAIDQRLGAMRVAVEKTDLATGKTEYRLDPPKRRIRSPASGTP